MEEWALTGPVVCTWSTSSPRVSVRGSSDLRWPHTKDSAQSYYSNELSKEDQVLPESENTRKNDQLGPRRELSTHMQNKENKKGYLRENIDIRKSSQS